MGLPSVEYTASYLENRDNPCKPYMMLSFYYITLICLLVIFIFLRLFTTSSLGKVLKAIAQNEHRVEALGYKTLHYKIIASIVAGVVAAFSGALYVITLRFVNTSVFSIEVTLDALLMTMLGGVGTLVGSYLKCEQAIPNFTTAMGDIVVREKR